MQPFTALGTDIARQWSRHNFDSRTLPSIAAEALAGLRSANEIGPDDIIRWIASTTYLPEQSDLEGKFGQPPITLYADSRLRIEALFWTTAATAIHAHGFSGAFTVLTGSSVQSTYDFQQRKRLNAHIILGHLSLREVTTLKRGDIETIIPGDGLIHSVFHLDHPSVSVVVRTHVDREVGIQYQYLRPGLAIDPFFVNPLTTRRLQCLAFLARLKAPSYVDTALTMLASADFFETYQILRAAWAELSGGSATEDRERLVAAASVRHGADIDAVRPVLDEVRREAMLVAQRDKIRNPEHRFFLALLLTVPSRDAICDLIRKAYPAEDPFERIMRWVGELSGRQLLGLEADRTNLSIFRHLLDGASPAEVVKQLSAEYSREEVEPMASAIEEHCGRIQRLAAFRPLFTSA